MSSPRLEDFDVLEFIGSGSFANCQKIRRKSNGLIYAWKEINYDEMTREEKALLISEVNVLKNIRHPFIIKYYGHILDKTSHTLYLIMEYCKEGDLRSLIIKKKKSGTNLKEDFIWKVLCQLTMALRKCHDMKCDGQIILHRDIKPANVFLSSKKDVKLGDFGFARFLNDASDFAQTWVGTPYYMSPELISHNPYNEKSDVWSLGCLIYELCALVPPFRGSNIHQLRNNIMEGNFSPIPATYSDELQSVISRMLSVAVSRRPTVEMLMNLPVLSVRYHLYDLHHEAQKLDENHNCKLPDKKAKETKLKSRQKKAT